MGGWARSLRCYTEDRDSDPLRPDRFSASGLRNRGLVVKVNRLFRF